MATSFPTSASSGTHHPDVEVLLGVLPVFAPSTEADRAKFRLPFAGGYLLLSEPPPTRLIPLIEKITGFGELAPNWDSYGASRVDPFCIAAAVEFALRMVDAETLLPQIAPTVRGGIQFEWHRNHCDLEIEIHSPKVIQVNFVDHQRLEEVEFELSQDLAPLRSLLNRLN
jgi:hypothetical protein